MEDYSECNIHSITDRVKQLLKDLFAAHVELAIEAKKWKSKYKKAIHKSNETVKGSPSLFDASNHSCDTNSSTNLSSIKKDLVTFAVNDRNLEINKNDVQNRVKVSQPRPSIAQKFLPNKNTFFVNASKLNLSKKQTVADTSNQSHYICTDSRSPPCKIKNKMIKTALIYKSPSIHETNIIGDNLPSDSERDFQSPEPFIPSWKRNKLSKPPLIVPDTEPINYEEFKTSTPSKIDNLRSRGNMILEPNINQYKPAPENSFSKTNISPKKQHISVDAVFKSPYLVQASKPNESKKYDLESLKDKQKPNLNSLDAAETLREFISPSPDKKKSVTNHKSRKRQASVMSTISKMRVKDDLDSDEDLFSFFSQSPNDASSSNKLNTTEIDMSHSEDIFANHSLSVGEFRKKDSQNKLYKGKHDGNELMDSQMKNPSEVDLEDQASIDDELPMSDSSSFDPDETYCPIMRQKELLDKQKTLNNKFSPLNNNSMMPGLDLSQYCNLDPDQTMDPNVHSPFKHDDDKSPLQIQSFSNFPDDQMQSDIKVAENIPSDPFHQKAAVTSDIGFPLSSTKCPQLGRDFSDGNCDETFDQFNDSADNKSIRNDKRNTASSNNFRKPALLDNSFDKVPSKSSDVPEYAHVDVVRKKNDRCKLDAFACEQCKKWYDAVGLSEEERKERMKSCRHRARYEPTSTPEHYWSMGFPDTQLCKDRGYIEIENDETKPVNRARRKKAYRKIF